MTDSKSQTNDRRSWAPPRVGLEVERRDRWEIVRHGTFAGLSAGFALGFVEIVVSTALRGDPWLPFDFAVAIVVGPEALAPAFPVVAAVALGTVVHILLSVLFGVVFLSALALTFQLSARSWLIILYGVVFALTVWEVNFLAVLPLGCSNAEGAHRPPHTVVERDRVVQPGLRPCPRRVRHLGPPWHTRPVVAD